MRLAGSTRAIPEVEAYLDLYALLRSKGLSDPAAQSVATRMMRGEEAMARPSSRFAALHG
ncbi:MAG: hypothetical protein VKI63_06135 [Cyanobium sp.]|nr:hypothetical protein [Cyanobium sp.]